MGQLSESQPVLLLVAVFSRHAEALAWARERAIETWGPVATESDRFAFQETDYYEPTMGPELQKQFWTFQTLIDPADLAQIKRQTNAWEDEYAAECSHEETRPLNIDPGYLTLSKLVLASTKNHAHRIYLRDGIFAEITLTYRHKCWQTHEWTFPDYARDDFQEYFTASRAYLHRQLRDRKAQRESTS